MIEADHNSAERDPRTDDAAQLADLYYYTMDRANKADPRASTEVREVAGSIASYCRFRALQDPEIGRAIVDAFEAFRDPDLTLALPETADDMRREAGWLREALGLPPADTPNEPPPAGS